MRAFRPRLWPTLITVPAVLVLLALGTWQVQRLFWKEALIAERQAGFTGPVTPWNDAADHLGQLYWHRVSASGRFLNDRELVLAARSMNGNPGYHIVTPFAIEGGPVLLVDRGWVPLDRKGPGTRPQGQLEGIVTLTGILRPGHQPNWLTPNNEPDKNFWFWIDIPAMARSAQVEDRIVKEGYLEADATPNPGGFPIGGQTRIDLPNDHLQYAITWYALAVALIVIYFLYSTGAVGADASDRRKVES
jgi:surfeit locus 1 family protein